MLSVHAFCRSLSCVRPVNFSQVLFKKETTRSGSGNPNHHRRRVGHMAETFFALAQRQFGAYTLGKFFLQSLVRLMQLRGSVRDLRL